MKNSKKNLLAMVVASLLASAGQAEEVVYEDSSVDWQYGEYAEVSSPAASSQPSAYGQPAYQQADGLPPVEYRQPELGYEQVMAQQPLPAAGGYDQYSYQEGSTDAYEQPAYQPPVQQSYEQTYEQPYEQSYAQQPASDTQYGQYEQTAQPAPAYDSAPAPAAAQFAPEVLGERLLTAARDGKLNDVRWLLRKGADPEYKAHANALSPLDLVVEGGWVDVAQVFRDEGVNFNKRGHLGVTYLHQAAAAGRLPMVKFLVGAGVSPNTTTAKDWTALHHAARFGHAEVVDYLLAAGANAEHRNSDGFRARELAMNARHIQIAQMF